MICSRWEGLATDPSKQRRGQQVRDQNHQAPPPLLSCLLRECGPPPIPGGGGGSLVRQHQVIPQTPNAAPWPRNDLMTKGEPVRFFPQKSGVGTSDMGTNSKVIGSRRGVGTVANQSHGGTEMLPISPGHWSAGRSRKIMRYSERTRNTLHLSVLVPAILHFLSWGTYKSAGCALAIPYHPSHHQPVGVSVSRTQSAQVLLGQTKRTRRVIRGVCNARCSSQQIEIGGRTKNISK